MIVSRNRHVPGVVRVDSQMAGPRVLTFDFFTGARNLPRGTPTFVRTNEAAVAAGRRMSSTRAFDDFAYAGEAPNFKFVPKGGAFAHQNGGDLTVAEDSHLLIPMKPGDTRLARRSAISAAKCFMNDEPL
jgi:hypothetical protein